MKLRNKKTGKIIEYSISLNQWSEDDQEWYLFGNYDSIDELKEEWEDYAKKEPLIKDPKIRKAVRVWAEAIELNPKYKTIYVAGDSGLEENGAVIYFGKKILDPSKIEDGRHYSIEELCGKEDY